MTKLRFAPSPTGALHVGNLRTALYNYLFARASGGEMILRIDDTDQQRSRPEYEDGIRRDLADYGLRFDAKIRQSDRFGDYERAFAKALEAGLIYPCCETRDELDHLRKSLVRRGLPPAYKRGCSPLSPQENSARQAAENVVYYRFDVGARDVAFEDLIRGSVQVSLSSQSDPVIRRADGMWLYVFCSVVDDLDMAISHVVRGEDHVTNTAVQIAMMEAMMAAKIGEAGNELVRREVPRFAHHNLLVGDENQRLSKRDNVMSLRQLLGEGIEPEAVLSLAGVTGTSGDPTRIFGIEMLVDWFSFDKVSRGPARYSHDLLRALNATFVRGLDVDELLRRERGEEFGGRELGVRKLGIRELGVSGIEVPAAKFAPSTRHREVVELLRGNIDKVADLQLWDNLLTGNCASEPLYSDWQKAWSERSITSDSFVLAGALGAVRQHSEWSSETAWSNLLAGAKERAKEATGEKLGGKNLFLPLRLALTSRADGPPVTKVAAFLTRSDIGQRLQISMDLQAKASR